MVRNKAVIIGIIVLILGLIIFGAILAIRSRSKQDITSTPLPEVSTLTKTIEDIPPNQRPFVALVPSDDGHWLTLYIDNVKNALTIEYELVYETEGPTQGAIGTIDLKSRTPPIEEKILLGTESKGKFKFDEGVEKGSLGLVFREENQDVKYQTDFHLQTAAQAKKTLNSLDKKFTFISQANLASGFYISMPTIGFPQTPEGEIVTGPYGIFSSSSSKNFGKITLETVKPPAKVQIFGWDKNNNKSKEYTTGIKITDNSISVEIPQLATFIIVSQKNP
jgi:hypothetical protein